MAVLFRLTHLFWYGNAKKGFFRTPVRVGTQRDSLTLITRYLLKIMQPQHVDFIWNTTAEI
jgi:hypothetical protein